MSDVMTPIPFGEIMNWILTEHDSHNTVFGVHRPFIAKKGQKLDLFDEHLDTPFGPAAGPNTQLTQNIIAAYYAGSRFFELKTVQIMDGEELSKCVPKPCITAGDECYNCEWSTELYVPQAYEEYVKAWFALKLISKEWGLGDPDGFIFNMSVGYTFDGVTSKKIDTYIEQMKNASKTKIWKECVDWANANVKRFKNVDKKYISSITPRVANSITVSTLHGCPPAEIEKIASYLIEKKHLNTFVKCNPTILGYASARKILDDLGFDYIAFDEHHFNEDLQYKDAVPMFTRLQALADSKKLAFGLKLSNTFPVDVKQKELPSQEMYMSGRSLYPLTIEMAKRISEEFDGHLRISFSGGIDMNNIEDLFDAGIWPITMATTILKPGGYQRLSQMGDALAEKGYKPYECVSVGKVAYLAKKAKSDPKNAKSIKPAPSRKLQEKVPLTSCFTAPCTHGCPIHQDIPEYVELVGKKKYAEALSLILEKNPLPFITGTICSHRCMDKCTRNFYDESVHIRDVKLCAAKNGFDKVVSKLKPGASKKGLKVAVIGGGPTGMAVSYFLGREGASVTLFEKRKDLGGIVRYVIPDFRIGNEAIDKDVQILKAMGVSIKTGKEAPALKELKASGFTHVVYAIGAWKHGSVALEKGTGMNVLDFLEGFNNHSLKGLGENLVIIGGGNTAMDAARTAKRVAGVKHSYLVYRRDRKNMPADEEELELALGDGVEFKELLAPKSLEGKFLICDEMKLGDPDASGRRAPIATGETVKVPCDTLIFATGEKVETEYLAKQGINLTEKGKPAVDAMLQTNIDGVYVVGDANLGPATVVLGIADARKVANAIVGEYSYKIAKDAHPKSEDCYNKSGKILPYDCAECETSRCLACNTVCECCVQVCPNRANLSIKVPGLDIPQIVHVDRMCNECGNCLIFCPYASRPYKDKLTLFSTEKEFDESDNSGFFRIKDKQFKVRINGVVTTEDLAKSTSLDKAIENTIFALLKDYSYLF